MMMKKWLLIFFCALSTFWLNAQDTFSIVAVDPETGEVGSAGASCVALTNFNLPPDFLGVLFPGEGAINTQAYYLTQNQNNATTRFQAGDTPQEIIDWLTTNDIQSSPEFRQYGVVRLIDDVPSSAGHTGSSTDDYKGHLTGPTYSIQGNILLGPEILEDMESNFLNTEGTLAERLMAALQGANVVGADTRCADNGTSSLFAFLKVAQPSDEFGDPSLVLGVDFLDNTGLEPIDSLQILFDQEFPSSSKAVFNNKATKVYPIPSNDKVYFEAETPGELRLQVFDLRGVMVYDKILNQSVNQIQQEQLGSDGVYLYNLLSADGQIVQSGKLLFL